MNVFRIKATWFLAILFVIAGFLAVVPLVAAAFMPAAPLAALVPELPQAKQIAWMPAGLAMPALLALVGLAVMFVGSWIASRQSRLLEWNRYRHEEAARRVFAYRGGEERVEPTLGKTQ